MLLWLPAGTDLNPLDVFVNDFVKAELVRNDVSTPSLLKKEAIATTAELRSDKDWLSGIAKTCRAFPKRVAWVASEYGRKVVPGLVKSEQKQ